MPESSEQDRKKAKKKAEVSRLQALKDEGVEDVEMPPCEAMHLIGYLYEIGPTMAAGMGEGPLSHSEIMAWQANTGIRLDSWEARCLRRLSIEFLAESQKSREPDRPAPWQDAPYVTPQPDRLIRKLKAAF